MRKRSRGLLVTNEITADDISRYLNKRDDFDLELFAYRTLCASGWDVVLGGTYVDAVTGKFRQFDVRASKTFSHGRVVVLCVECKGLRRENPLVVSRVERPFAESYHDILVLRPRPQIGDVVPSVAHCQATGPTLYRQDEFAGKSMTQISKKNNDEFKVSDAETYDKWFQALASSEPLITEIAHTPANHSAPAFYFFMPVLVISDETLWVVDYQADRSRMTPRLENEAVYFVNRDFKITYQRFKGNYRQPHLHIETRVGFERLIQKLDAPDSRFMDKIFGQVLRSAP